jgi:hypothetical protein
LFEPNRYAAIKNSLETSSSVTIINQLTAGAEVDFPKSVVLDTFLSFGVYGLFILAILIAQAFKKIEEKIGSFADFSLPYITALFALPMLMEFEKEALGILISFAKWSPMLVFAFLVRPRIVSMSPPFRAP